MFSPTMTNFRERVSRLDRAAVQRLFPPSQIAQWPNGYLPASGVAHFLSPNGVPFSDLVDCHREIKTDRQHELQRDFAADYSLWCRETLIDFLLRLDYRQKRKFRRFTARSRAMHDSEVRELFDPAPRSDDAVLRYEFTAYATTQEYAMLPVSRCTKPDTKVNFTCFPQIRNVLHTDFDSMGPLRAVSMLSDDNLVPTSEFVQALAHYLRHRVEEIITGEEVFRSSRTGSNTNSVPSGFSLETPVVSFFGNGRLAWLLNNSELLPFKVRPVQPPLYASRRERRWKHLSSQTGFLQNTESRELFADSFSAPFPCESIEVTEALRKYRPCVALVEPHVDRDWLCDIRGFYSSREVIMLGAVDSPQMGSFAFPFLTFGVTPGPTTYWTYSDTLQRVSAATRVQMPMDPPHDAQGYKRQPLDEISSYLLSPNDCHAFGNQYRCLSFVRTVYPLQQAAVKS